jgi:predicted phage terminase large subunit-like protein
VLAGRGFGKTRTGAEWVRDQIENHGRRRVALVAPTAGDARDVMVEGESGLLSIYPPSKKPLYEPSKRRITFANGALATTYSADEPERLRGPQHDSAWCDEGAAWNYPEDAWDMLQFGLRLGNNPQVCFTTTPKPIPLVRQLLKSSTTAVTRGTTYENRANLAEPFFQEIVSKYEGTRLGRQELNAEVLEDVEGALWERSWIDATRMASIKPRDLQRIVVAIDPAVTNTEDSDDTGIVVAAKGADGRGYVLDDATCRMSPDGWARRAVGILSERQGDRIIAEVNNGGDLVERVVRTVDSRVPYKAVHASRGKITRAEPIAALYEQGKISHVGSFPQLEDEMCTYTGLPGEKSPNRMDALVWALSELFLEAPGKPRMLWV